MKIFNVNNYITKYVFGNPFNTESTVLKGEKEILNKDLKYFDINDGENSFVYKLEENDIVYGLGENVRGINKRGNIYESFCSDIFSHTPDKRSLYGAHNFILIYGKETFGVFIDYPGKVTFDIGYTDSNLLNISLEDNNFNLYIIEGKNLNSIVKNFRKLIGKSYVAPKWALGYGQSRWGYRDKEDYEELLEKFKKAEIPIDCLYLDIDYMDEFKNFTVNEELFKDFDSFASKVKKEGIRLVPIIDAGCKIEKGYDVYEEGIKNNYYCVDKDNKPFVGAVWPGKVHFPDFLNKDARLWFGSKYKFLTDKGIEGFWNDMNEPAIFYSENGLKKAFEKVTESKDKNLGIHDYFDLRSVFDNLQNSMEDYKSFYHNVNGKLVRHDKIHNLYGFNMTRAASEGLNEIDSNKRFLLFSRASTIGMHRYGGIWTGDNASWWEHIKLAMQMMPNINMCGFIYTGSDTGGFGSNATKELIIRWSQFSLFTPLFRNHSATGTRCQEPYAFGKEAEDILKNIIELRYVLIPYLYSEYMKAVLNDELYFKPLTFDYNDEFTKRVEDQLLLGDSIMIAPIYEQNSKGRYVYLPEDMLLWKCKKYNEGLMEVINKGNNYIDVDLNEVPIFIRKNKILVMANKKAKRVLDIDDSELNLVAFVESKASYSYYNDDGKTNDYKCGKSENINIVIEKNNDDYKISLNRTGLEKVKKLNIKIFDVYGILKEKEIII